jgi:hypothetical protein
MQIFRLLIVFATFFSVTNAKPQSKKYKVHTIAFYNIENFYDTINDPNTRDDEWVYSKKYYLQKVSNIAKIISQLGTADNPNAPAIIGLTEVENRMTLETLVKDPQITALDYGIIHYDSPDRRGIDCAFLYQKKHFKPTSSKNIPLYIYESDTNISKKNVDDGDTATDDKVEVDQVSKRIYTRDQILLTGLIDNEEMHFIVNHWPSRRGGEAISRPLREKAAALNIKIIDSLQKINKNAKIITMGDLNDGPFNDSLKKVLKAKGKKSEVPPLGLYNPMEGMANKGFGTLAYRDAWDIFDQMIMTEPFIQSDYSQYRFWKAGIYNKSFMIQPDGRYKGYGLRNNDLVPGFSDHFPVYVYLIKEVK